MAATLTLNSKAKKKTSLTVRDLDEQTPKTKRSSTTKPKPLAKKTAAKKTVKKKLLKKDTSKKTVRKTVVKKVVTKKTTAKKTKVATKKAEETVVVVKRTVKKTPTHNAHSKKTILEQKKREPLAHLLVEKLLREAGFAGGVSTNQDVLERYSQDESIFAIRPQIVLQPKSVRDIEIAVKTLSQETDRFPALSLTARSGGTGLSGGSLTDSVLLDVKRYLNKIHQPKITKKGITITVEPGARFKDIEKELKHHQVYLPAYPDDKETCTIGGSVANNTAGPDSLRYGQIMDWVEEMDITLYDGKTYTLKPITYKEFRQLSAEDNALGHILTQTFALLEKHEKAIAHAKPKTSKSTAGFPLWQVIDGSVASFKRGKATMNLARLVAGSQGSVGVITSITLRTEPIKSNTELVVVPIFDLMDASTIITEALKFNPINLEFFDGLTYDLAMQNPGYFRNSFGVIEYYQAMFKMYSLYHVNYFRKLPEITLLITLDQKAIGHRKLSTIINKLKVARGKKARHVTNRAEQKMFWQIRFASYALGGLISPHKRPAAFLEDVIVPPENMSKFLVETRKLLRKYNLSGTFHGHGGDGHLHFYPLLDFTQKSTADLIEKLADEFFDLVTKYDGNLCGEHNDGIIRTPHLDKMFNKAIIHLFEQVEKIFDPQDIFNPGKKVNPRFNIKDTIRHTN